jgi:long-chain acyl-CoA synthetase
MRYSGSRSMGFPPLTQCFLDAVDRFANPSAQLYRGRTGWEAISAQEMLRRVAGLSRALGGLGVKPGDRVGLLAPNCPEWHIVDFAAMGIGAATVPIYFNESQERLQYILSDSGAKIAVAVGEERLTRILAARGRLPALERIIAVAGSQPGSGEVLQYDALIAGAGPPEIADYRRRAGGIEPNQLATIIYTSGTTGEPKGVMLSHSNLSSNAADSLRDYGYGPSDLALSFLPLSHVYERVADYAYLFRGISIAYLEEMDQVRRALLEVRPTVMAAVPRFFEKLYANMMEQAQRASGLRRAIFDWAMRVSREAIPWRAYGEPVSWGVKISWWLAYELAYCRIRAGLGGRIRSFSSGGAPLSKELAEFFWAVGIPIYQGYGLTETSPVVAANVPGANRVGTVGRPIANVEVRIAEDGEILVRGACVMQGYYHKPAETQEAFTPDSWLRTGDIGYLDADGYLIVTDRKKELLKTSAGKYVAPQPIENLLKSSPYILNAAAVGDKRKFVCVLLVPNFPAIAAKARQAGIEISSPAELATHPWVRGLIAAELERLTARLAQYEKPKRFALLDHDFTFDAGQLTYTMKLKRRVIEERYKDVIEQLYAEVEEPRPQPQA